MVGRFGCIVVFFFGSAEPGYVFDRGNIWARNNVGDLFVCYVS